jgi:hypothetical protein
MELRGQLEFLVLMEQLVLLAFKVMLEQLALELKVALEQLALESKVVREQRGLRVGKDLRGPRESLELMAQLAQQEPLVDKVVRELLELKEYRVQQDLLV